MVRFFDRLLNNNQNFVPIQGIQIDENGQAYNIDTPPMNRRGTGLSLVDRLLGQKATNQDSIRLNPQTDFTNEIKQRFEGISDADIQNIQQGLNGGNKDYAAFIDEKGINKPSSQEDVELAKAGNFNVTPDIKSTITDNPRRGGIIPDVANGFRENLNNAFSPNNLTSNELTDGRNKGFAYRMGEGLGSIARLLESPTGRGLLMGGIVNATGGNGLQALQYGLQAGVGNQQNRTADKLYRTSLNDMGIDTSNIRGYVNSDTYKNYALTNYRNQSLAVRQAIANANDNTKRANLIMTGLNNGTITPQEAMQHMTTYGLTLEDLRRSNASRNADINEFLAPAREYALKTAPEVALGNLGLGYARLNAQQKQNDIDNAFKARELKQKEVQGNAEFDDIRAQLDNFSSSFETVNNPYRYRAAGWVSNKLNTLTNDEANFNAQRTLLFNQIARKLGGEKGVLSDNDIKRIEAALPTLSDTMQQKQAKMRAVYSLLDIKTGNSGKADPLGIR